MSGELARLEIDRYDWNAMTCGCRQSAGHLGADLLSLAKGYGPRSLDDHLLPAGEVIVEPTIPALSVLLAIIADPPSASLDDHFRLVLGIVPDDNAWEPSDFPGRTREDVIAEVRATARQGLWLYYAEVLSGRNTTTAGYAFEILEVLDEPPDRLERLRTAAGDRLP